MRSLWIFIRTEKIPNEKFSIQKRPAGYTINIKHVSKFLYLLVNLLSIALPLMYSFYKRPDFSPKWKFLWPAILISSTGFILWDMAFTRMGIWGFNPKYITGI